MYVLRWGQRGRAQSKEEPQEKGQAHQEPSQDPNRQIALLHLSVEKDTVSRPIARGLLVFAEHGSRGLLPAACFQIPWTFISKLCFLTSCLLSRRPIEAEEVQGRTTEGDQRSTHHSEKLETRLLSLEGREAN